MVDFDEHLSERFSEAMQTGGALGKPAPSKIALPFVGRPTTPALELETSHGDVIRMASLEQLGRVKVCLKYCVDVGLAARDGMSGDGSPRHAQVD